MSQKKAKLLKAESSQAKRLREEKESDPGYRAGKRIGAYLKQMGIK